MNRKQLTAVVLFSFLAIAKSDAQVVINEVQSSNFSTIPDENGQYEDWIELYNAGSSSVDLAGYGLSDNANKLFKFTFPSFQIPSNDHVLIFANDTNQNFVGAHWASAVRADDTWRYRANTSNPNDTNWRNLSFNETTWNNGSGGIGYSDGDDVTVVSTCASLFMRKTFSISDTSKILDGVFNIDYDDGFVAFLNGVEIARANVGLPGDRPSWNTLATAAYEAQMYQNMPCDSFHLSTDFLRSIIKNGTNVLAVEVHNQTTTGSDLSSIPFLSFKIKDATVMFSALPSWFHATQHSEDYFHAAFKISKTGEAIYLTNSSGTIVDQISIPTLELDNAYGRNTDGENSWKYFETPTPDTTNSLSNGFNGYATIPLFSLQGGFYSGTQTLTLSTTYPGGVIRYTTNGNTPTNTSPVYSSPITIGVTTSLRARVFSPTSLPSQTLTNTYFINVDCKLPVYCLTLDSADLWDYNKGIFVKGPNASPNQPYFGANYWQDWQKLMTLEFFDKQKNRAFRFNGGLSITGGWSRRSNQKSLEIKLGDKFGMSKIQYEMIPDKKWIDKWDDFLLHTTGNDRGIAHMRDPVMERLMKGTNSDYTAFEPCLLFINGARWGVYYTKENDDQNFVKENYGYSKSEIDLLKESYFYPDIEVKCGSDSAFRAMHSYAMNTSPSSASFYSKMDSMIEIKNQVDYFAAECYYPNDDWMGSSNNNLKLWRPRKTGGRFRYILYDLDFGFGMSGTVSSDILSIAMNANPHNYNSDIFQRLLLNAKYKNYFINRYADLINTIWQQQNVVRVVNNFRDSIRYDMHYQFDKWGGGDTNTWNNNIASMLTFSNGRAVYARNQIQSDLGMTGQVTLTLQASPSGAGRIQISTITPQTLPWSGVYFNGNPVTVTAIPNPGYTFDHWNSNIAITTNDTNKSVTRNFTSNDVITAYFTGSAVTPQITISEINYNSDSASNSGDWFELHNLTSVNLDISGWKVRDDNDHHEFVFPVSTLIAANGYLVVAEDTQKFHSQHPSVMNIIGEAGFNLSDGGDQIRLFNFNDSLFLSMEYSDQDPWTSAADGNGYTLELRNSSGDLNDGNNWFAGCLGGSPGVAYSAPVAAFTTSGATTICVGDTLILSATTSTGNNFQWQRNHVDINGATGNLFQPMQSGTYTVVVTNNGCSSVSDSSVVTITPYAQNPIGASVSHCGTESVTLTANSADSVVWYDDQGNFLATGNNFTTPVLNQTTVYRVQAGSLCASAVITDTVFINTVPADPVVADQNTCGHGLFTFLATSDSIVRWYDAPNGNLISTGDIFSTPDIYQTTIYYIQAGDFCRSNFIPATAIVNIISADPVTNNVSRCDAGVLTLNAAASDTIRWYDSPSGNLLSTGNSFTTPSLNQTTTYYLRAEGLCPGNFVSVDAIVDSVSSTPVSSDQTRCGDGSVTLTATGNDTIRWYDFPNGNLLSTGNSFSTPLLTQSTAYYVRAEGICQSNFVAVNAIINSVSADVVSSDQSRCGSGSFNLSATANDTVRWYDSPNGNLLYEGNIFSTPILNQTTTYYARAEGICPSNFTSVSAVINTIPADPVSIDQSRCGEGSVTLNSTGADTLRWYDAPNGNLLSTGNSFVTPLLGQSTTFYLRAEEICSSVFVPVNAIINSLPADPVVSSGSTCGNGTVILTATSPDTIAWYNSPNGALIGTGILFQTPFLNSTTTYFVQATNGCAGDFVSATAFVFSAPQVSLGSDTIIESGTIITLDAGSGFASYLWGTGETTQTSSANSTGNYWVTVTNGNGCSATDTIQVLVTVNVQPYVLTEGVLIYPNPTHSTISISFMNEGNEDIFLRLVDDNGKLVWSDFSVNEKRVMRSVDLTQYARGLYVFQIATSKSKHEYKVVLK